MLIQSIIASVITVLGALGSIIICSRINLLQKYVRYVVSISIGVLIGLVFFDLIPETLEQAPRAGMYALILGFLFFIILSRVLKQYHHHHENDECAHTHVSDGKFIVLGDAIHNMVDGIIIITAFSVSTEVGIAATIGIFLHELPQEIAEYFILINAGYTKFKAIFYNALSASTILIGVGIGYLFLESATAVSGILLGIASGNILYVILSDLVPRFLTKSQPRKKLFIELMLVCIGVLLMVGIIETYGHGHEDERNVIDVERHIGQSTPQALLAE